jgi:hypothetical protein
MAHRHAFRIDFDELAALCTGCPEHLEAPEIERRLNAVEEQSVEVENCKNWLEISIVRGEHCYNCANRNGYPMKARPSKVCENYADALEKSEDDAIT